MGVTELSGMRCSVEGLGSSCPTLTAPRSTPPLRTPWHGNKEQPDHGSAPHRSVSVGVTSLAPNPNFSAQSFTEESFLPERENKMEKALLRWDGCVQRGWEP